MTEIIDFLQWPAMVVTLLAAWMIGSNHARRRMLGFGLFLLSNVLWIAWGWNDEAYALIGLQLGLIIMNVRGILKNEDA
ncbi:hypothetical protein [Massilia glaciei]|uniref:Amino acid transporter n=1 Tax=Massilia glaciei TaxID=1524097 RepID=A0A2U2HNQ6_9BURK|nr:hypothetical protein [Massilia glaciei]PWF49066.1 hypothetical protein C7C56_008555 [Massilia glaciei]